MVSERQNEEINGIIRKAATALEEGDRLLAWETVAQGLKADPRNYELYMLLGDYYSSVNLCQAYLCYENARHFCEVPEDGEVIEDVLEKLEEAGARPPKTAIVVLSCNLMEMTRNCIESIRETVPERAREIIVVDNGSTDGSVEYLEAQKDIRLLCNRENRGFPAACNQGIGLAEEESDIYLLNNDTVLTDNSLFWLRMGLYEDARNGSAGSVTNHVSNGQTVVEDGRDRDCYLAFARENNVPMEYPYLNKVWLVGFSLLIKREALNKIGLLDERFSPGNYEDNDLCLRLMLAGYRNVLCKNSFLIHWGSSTFRKDVQSTYRILRENHARFLKKWEHIGLRDDNYISVRTDMEDILQEHHDASRDRILIVGTGFGKLPSRFQGIFPGAQIWGIEKDPVMAGIADCICDTVCADLKDWNGGELAESFDTILVDDSALDYTEMSSEVLAELVRMLRRGGCLILSFPNGWHFSRIPEQNAEGKYFTRTRMERLLKSCGMKARKWNCTQIRNMNSEQAEEVGRAIDTIRRYYPEVEPEELLAWQWIVTAEKG